MKRPPIYHVYNLRNRKVTKYDNPSDSNISLDSNEESEESEYDLRDDFKYLGSDNTVLINAITNNLKSNITQLNNVPVSSLRVHVEKAIKPLNDIITDEYYGEVPADILWEYQCDPGVDKVPLKNELVRIRSMMKWPTLADILSAKITDENKQRAVAMYDISQNIEQYTLPHYDLYNSIKKLINSSGSLSKEELEGIQKDEKRLNTHATSNTLMLKKKVYDLNATDAIKSKLYSMCNELAQMSHDTSEYSVLRGKLNWAISLPYHTASGNNAKLNLADTDAISTHCAEIYATLNTHLHGLAFAKEKLLQSYVNRLYNRQSRVMIGFCSPPGFGKTAIAGAWAKSIGLPFERISLGGLLDSSIFTGSDNVWSGASPSVILKILSRMKVRDGVVLFDEIDKLGATDKGREIQYALLHITDYTQNSEFQDLFLSEFSHDISNMQFLFGMNNSDWLDATLADRINIIKLPQYSSDEINHIIKCHFLPAAITNCGLESSTITMNIKTCNHLRSVLSAQFEIAGLRPMQRAMDDIVSKIRLYSVGINIKLSFKVPNFSGFPYEITPECINMLVDKKLSNDMSTFIRNTMYT